MQKVKLVMTKIPLDMYKTHLLRQGINFDLTTERYLETNSGYIGNNTVYSRHVK